MIKGIHIKTRIIVYLSFITLSMVPLFFEIEMMGEGIKQKSDGTTETLNSTKNLIKTIDLEQSLEESIQALAPADLKNNATPKNEPDSIFAKLSNELIFFSKETNKDVKKLYNEKYNLAVRHQKAGSRINWLIISILLSFIIFRSRIEFYINHITKLIRSILLRRFINTAIVKRKLLRNYLTAIKKKNRDVKIVFSPEKPLRLEDIYVPLKINSEIDGNSVDVLDILENQERLVITAPPGSGKSILIKQIAVTYARKNLDTIYSVPIPLQIELWRLNTYNEDIKKLIFQIIKRSFPNYFDADSFSEWALHNGKIILLFDGLDEVSSDLREKITLQIINFLEEYPLCKAVITCRTAVYKNEFIEITSCTRELLPFDDLQIRDFLQYWDNQLPKGKTVEELIASLQNRPKILALARNPLMLTIISFLYTSPSFIIPHSRAEFYNRAVDILLRQWRNKQNRYDAAKKRIILEHLAVFNQEASLGNDRLSIDLKTILKEIKEILPDLDLNITETESILNEIIERSGLLIQIDGGMRFQFTHLTLQEYFAATAFKNKPIELINRYRVDKNVWEETIKLWCGLAQDSTYLISEIRKLNPILALNCLSSSKKLDANLTNEIINDNFALFERNEKVQGAIAEIMADPLPNKSKLVYTYLKNRLEEGSLLQKEKVAKVLAISNLTASANLLGLYYQKPFAKNALKQMGDVAISTLHELAKYKYQDEVIDDLFSIGTPKAAEALVRLLSNVEGNKKTRAALYLGTLINRKDIERRLEKASFNFNTTKLEYGWIWEPFMKNDTNTIDNIQFIVNEITKAIIDSEDEIIALYHLKINERIIIPICSISTINIGLKKLNKKFISENLKKYKQENWSEEELLNTLIDHERTVGKYFRLVKPEKLTDLLRRIINLRDPTIEDWKNLFTITNYSFFGGPHFILTIFILGLFPLLYRIHIAWQSEVLGQNLTIDEPYFLLLFIIWVSAASLISIPLDEVNTDKNTLEVIIETIFALAIAAILLKINWMIFASLQEYYSKTSITIIFITISTSAFYTYHLGIKKEHQAQNPLHGILDDIKY